MYVRTTSETNEVQTCRGLITMGTDAFSMGTDSVRGFVGFFFYKNNYANIKHISQLFS